MDAFVDGGFSGPDLRVLNQIRLCLQVISVANISCPDSVTLCRASFMAESGNGLQKHLTWPHPVPLSPRLLSLWQRALSLSLLCLGTTTRRLKPCFEVGHWFDIDLLSNWPWHYSPDSNMCPKLPPFLSGTSSPLTHLSMTAPPWRHYLMDM